MIIMAHTAVELEKIREGIKTVEQLPQNSTRDRLVTMEIYAKAIGYENVGACLFQLYWPGRLDIERIAEISPEYFGLRLTSVQVREAMIALNIGRRQGNEEGKKGHKSIYVR